MKIKIILGIFVLFIIVGCSQVELTPKRCLLEIGNIEDGSGYIWDINPSDYDCHLLQDRCEHMGGKLKSNPFSGDSSVKMFCQLYINYSTRQTLYDVPKFQKNLQRWRFFLSSGSRRGIGKLAGIFMNIF